MITYLLLELADTMPVIMDTLTLLSLLRTCMVRDDHVVLDSRF